MKIILDEAFNWNFIKISDYSIWYVGDIKEWRSIFVSIVKLGKNPNKKQLDLILNKSSSIGASIIKSSDNIIAFVDHFRCYPIYYMYEGEFIITNNARKLVVEKSIPNRLEKPSVEEFMMTGFVTGSNTLIKKIKQLQSGERIIYSFSDSKINLSRYYRYTPTPEHYKSDEDWVDELDKVISKITDRMIERAADHPIRVTLSAGLDSRVLVCKLHEAKYKNFETFSYGPFNNWEAKGAKKVAEQLNVPWQMVGITKNEAKSMFWNPKRIAYWNFSDGLSSLPNYQEYFALEKLRKIKILPDNVILINGQSGDFISGGHIPKILMNKKSNVYTLLNVIINKHYGLWLNLMTQERVERIKSKILHTLNVKINDNLSTQQLICLYERWECEERQVKWVIHAQRVNDFFNYKWQLPLWDIQLVQFFEKVPFHLKFNQKLYKMWLNRWNYKNLFKNFNPTVWRWPGATVSVVPLAKGIEIFLGKKAKDSWYELFFYWGHNAEQFAPYKYSEYFKARKNIRNCISLNIRTWAKENMIPLNIIDVGQ